MSVNKTFIVAEIGNNHEGNFNLALKLIDAAKNSGADAVKFQTFDTDYFLDKNHPKFSMYKKFELTKYQFEKLANYSKKKKIKFFSTPLDLKSAIFLNKIQKIFKIASGDINFYQLLKLVSSFKKKLIISTGASNINEIDNAVKIVKSIWNKKFFSLSNLSLMHCVSEYPANIEKINLNTINFLKKNYPLCKIGFSDHTIGLEAPIYARCGGAEIIEKHFTLNNNFSKFRDHSLSLNPKDFKDLVKKIRDLDKIFGIQEKLIYPSEKKNLKFIRRKVLLKNNLLDKKKIKDENLLFIRSNNGIHIEDISKKINKKLKLFSLKKGFIKKNHLKKIKCVE